jgi:hypothetical protein
MNDPLSFTQAVRCALAYVTSPPLVYDIAMTMTLALVCGLALLSVRPQKHPMTKGGGGNMT